jgi:uncharacterized protein YwqG
MIHEEAVSHIRKSDLGESAETIIANLRPSVLIEAKRVPLEELPLGASRIGGVPDLPKGFQWPRWCGSKMEFIPLGMTSRQVEFRDKDLHFIAQLNLKEFGDFSACKEIPSNGFLYFFYDCEVQPWGFDPANHHGARVIYIPDQVEPLTRYEPPQPDSGFDSSPSALSFAEDWTIPDRESFGFDYAALESIEELKQDLIGTSEDQPFKPIHRLFGWPEPVQGDMQLECQLVANGIYCGDANPDPRSEVLADGAKDWQLLLQIDTDEANPGWMWGDCGRIYYWIHKNDLRDRRFENARLILQCS